MAKYIEDFFPNIKLVIWDLDETFWLGTLDDGDSLEITPINIELVKKLTDYGIVNAVCSKNDKTKAEKFLADNSILDYFVFNSIDWTPKGILRNERTLYCR